MFKRRRRRSRRLMGIRVRRVISNICKHGRHTPKLGKYAGFTVLGSVVQKQVQNLNPGLTENLKQIFQTFICKLENFFSHAGTNTHITLCYIIAFICREIGAFQEDEG